MLASLSNVSFEMSHGGPCFTQLFHSKGIAIFLPLFSDIASQIAFNLLLIIKNCEKTHLNCFKMWGNKSDLTHIRSVWNRTMVQYSKSRTR